MYLQMSGEIILTKGQRAYLLSYLILDLSIVCLKTVVFCLSIVFLHIWRRIC